MTETPAEYRTKDTIAADIAAAIEAIVGPKESLVVANQIVAGNVPHITILKAISAGKIPHLKIEY